MDIFMAMNCLIIFNMILFGLLVLLWSTKQWVNVMIKFLLLLAAVANLLMLMYLEGYIVKIIH